PARGRGEGGGAGGGGLRGGLCQGRGLEPCGGGVARVPARRTAQRPGVGGGGVAGGGGRVDGAAVGQGAPPTARRPRLDLFGPVTRAVGGGGALPRTARGAGGSVAVATGPAAAYRDASRRC